MATFKWYLNRQGPQGQRGQDGAKGDPGNTPIFSDGQNTPTVYTMIIDLGDGNTFETKNLKYPMRDDGGDYLRYDISEDTVYLGEPNKADLAGKEGEVRLATTTSVNEETVLDTDAVSYELFEDNNEKVTTALGNLDDKIEDVDDKVDAEADTRARNDGILDNRISLAEGQITSLNNTKASKQELTDGLAGKANVIHTHTLSQITDAGSLAGKNTVNYQTEVTNKPTLGNLASKDTVNYETEVTNKPVIPIPGDGTITITQGGVTKGTFTTNQSSNATIALDAGGGASFTAGTGLELTNQDVLNVKIDGSTITTNANGELVASGGATYTEGPGITIDGNNTISVNYDSTKGLVADGTTGALGVGVDGTTIDVDNNGKLTYVGTTGDTLPSQTGNSGKFLTTDGSATSWAAIPQPDLTNYYTKTQTDSLLDGKISNNIVRYPLEYLPDTTGSLRTYNLTNMQGTTIGAGINVYVPSWGDTEPHVDVELLNGINLYIKDWLLPQSPWTTPPQTRRSIKFGYYDNNDEFVSVAAFIPGGENWYSILTFYDSTQPSGHYDYNLTNYDMKGSAYPYNFVSYDPTSHLFGYVGNSSGIDHYWGGQAIISREQDIEALALCTVCRFTVATDRVGDVTNYGAITVSNPSITNYPFYSHCNKCNDGDSFLNAYIASNPNNIFDVHGESLSLKYDSNTLGVNANNELTVPTATTSNKGLVQPDGTTITINNGVISAAGSAPSNMVTTDTSQTISASKAFHPADGLSYCQIGGYYGTHYGGYISAKRYDSDYPERSTMFTVNLGNNKGGSISFSDNNLNNIGGLSVDYDFLTLKSRTGTYYVQKNNSNNLIIDQSMLDGTTITYNSSTGKISAAGGSTPTKKTITQASANVSQTSSSSAPNYTVVGSPTITTSGSDLIIASNSTNDYVQSINKIDIDNNIFKIKTAFIYDGGTLQSNLIYCQDPNQNAYGWSIYQESSGIGFWCNKDGNNLWNEHCSTTITQGVKYYIIVQGNGSQIDIKISTDDITYTTIGTVSTSANLVFTGSPYYLRTQYTAGRLFLNETYIEKNGIVITQLAIPSGDNTVTVTDADVTTSTIVTLYPSDTTTETWLANNLASNIITEGSGSFTFTTNDTLPSTFSMYYIIQEVN